VVVVHPDQIAILYVLHDCLGEEAVYLSVGGPGRLVEGDLTGVVVEERPEDGVFKGWQSLVPLVTEKKRISGKGTQGEGLLANPL
jgi:hypothetical protein